MGADHPSGPLDRAGACADTGGVAVHDLGGSGPPVLLVHATGFHGHVWGPVAAGLAADFRCLAPDLPGHGDSTPADGDFGWHGFADAVLAVVDRWCGERPYGVGHSSGATALLLAEQARPGTFRSLYCFEPVVVPADPPLGRDPHSWLADRARRRRDAFASRAAAMAHFAARLPHVHPDVLALYVDHGVQESGDGSVRLACRPEHEARIYEMATAHDAYGRLPQVACLVTLAYGEESEAASPEQIAHLAGRLPHARTQPHPGLGHLGPLEDPAGVTPGILMALTGDSPPPAWSSA